VTLTSETRRLAPFSGRLTFAAYASFVPIGIVNVILGPMLPVLSSRWSLNYSQAGGLFIAQYLASTVAVGLSGLVVARYGFRLAINSGMLITAAATASLLSGSTLLGTLCIAGIGGGIGLAVPAANLLVAEENPHRRGAALNVLNFCWSAGAVASPFLVASTAGSSRLPAMLVAVAAIMLCVVLGIAIMPRSTSDTTAAQADKAAKQGAFNWRTPALPVLAAIFFIYVGTENAIGGWVSSYSKSLGNVPGSVSTMMPSFFYGALTLGRWIAPMLLRAIEEAWLAQIGLLISCGASLALLFSHTLTGVLLSACLGGFGLSSVYPITIAMLSREFGPDAPRAGSLMFTLSNLGGGMLPWLVGIFSTRTGSLKTGLIVPLVGCAMMFVLYLRNWQPGARKSA
jgi:MFS transporter, FHS family, glucose/mannose:H+ symporter